MSRQPREDSINEMESIQKGLEAFLEQELQKEQLTQREQIPPVERKPQIYDMEKPEKELDIIGGTPKQVHKSGNEDYLEDWDSPERRKSARRRNNTATTTEGRAAMSQRGSRSGDTEEELEYQAEKSVRAVGREGARAGRTGARSRAGATSRAGTTSKAGRTGKATKATKETKTTKSSKKQTKEPQIPQGSGKSPKEPKKKKSKLKKFLIIVAIILVILFAGLYYLVGVVYNNMKYEEIASLTTAPMQKDGVVNILLIGNDSRENGEDGRSDAMILLSISNRTKKIYMTSLLRDMYVEIPGHDGNRLNAAYSFGGAELLMETIEQNLGITVNRYMLVNFEAFANLVDAVGGVELDLTSQEVEYVNGYLVEYNMLLGRAEGTDYMDTTQSGIVHLNGPQALAYSRNRFLGTDFGRTERQRKVLEAVIKKLPKTMLTNPVELMNGLLPNLTTNLTRTECFRLSLMGGKVLTYDIEQLVLPQPGTYSNATIRGMAVLEVDFAANRQYLEDALQGVTEDKTKEE